MLDISELVLGVGLGAGGYSVIPDVCTRFIGSRVIRSLRDRAFNQIALTFDDGPDPRYTPQLLDLLRRHNAKATFFLVGEKVRRYPDLTRRIRAEGHLIGCHTLSHRFAWVLGPQATVREVRDCIDAITEVLGERPRWFRPPWGAHNAVTLLSASLSRQRTILWDVSLRDWRRRNDPRKMADRLLEKVHPGAIVLLHDSGGQPGAPLNTLSALELALPVLANCGYRFVTVEELAPRSDRTPPSGRRFGRRKSARLQARSHGASRQVFTIRLQ